MLSLASISNSRVQYLGEEKLEMELYAYIRVCVCLYSFLNKRNVYKMLTLCQAYSLASFLFGLSTGEFCERLKIQMLDLLIPGVYCVSMEKAMAPHSSTLAWRIPWMEEPGELPSMGSHRVRRD